MRCFSLYLLLLLGLQTLGQTRKVRLKLFQYKPYCGEATSKKELKKSPDRAISYVNKTLICISDEQKIDTVKTDSKGYLILTLHYGSYHFYEPWKYYHKKPPEHINSDLDPVCLTKEWETFDLKVNVSKKTITVANNLLLPLCPDKFPCLKPQP